MTAAAPAPVEIAPAAAGEAKSLARLHAACFGSGWRAADMAAYADDPACTFLAARGARGLLGLILCRAAAGEAEILTLAVAAPARRRGVARALCGAALAALAGRGVGRVVLEVGRGNDAARDLYGGLGFRQVGRRQHYYQDGREDALLMALESLG